MDEVITSGSLASEIVSMPAPEWQTVRGRGSKPALSTIFPPFNTPMTLFGVAAMDCMDRMSI